MRIGALGQFSAAEFENCSYTGVRWGFQPHFCDLMSRSGKND